MVAMILVQAAYGKHNEIATFYIEASNSNIYIYE